MGENKVIMVDRRGLWLWLLWMLIATTSAETFVTEFMGAARDGDFDFVEKALQDGVDLKIPAAKSSLYFPAYYPARALPLAAANGHLEIVQALLEAGADIETPGFVSIL